MEWDGKIASAAQRCTATGRELVPGETVIAALVQEGALFVRRDFAQESWPAQDATAFLSWWRRKVPLPDAGKRLRLDADVLGKLFHELKDADDHRQRCLAYVAALCLARMRVLRMKGIERSGTASFVVLEERGGTGVQHRIRDPQMDAADQEAVHRNLLDVVGVS